MEAIRISESLKPTRQTCTLRLTIQKLQSASVYSVKALSKYLAALMAITAVVTSNGWHLPIIQSVAWISMYGDYRESMSAEDALDAALGGESLCNLCQYVQNSNPTQEEESPYWQSEKSNPLIVGSDNKPRIKPLPRTAHLSDYHLRMIIRWEEKESPPPKPVLV
jgi:hypothetical protein